MSKTPVLWSAITGNAGQIDGDEAGEIASPIMLDDEEAHLGFKVGRDTLIFTGWRLILVDRQGLTGKKVEYMSLPYGSISRFSIETPGVNDWDAELKVWISSAAEPVVSKRFNRKVNIYAVSEALSVALRG